MIARVVELALARALESLPPGGIGVRCHALPLDERLDECLAGVDALLARPEFSKALCVVGTSAKPRTSPPRTKVLSSDLAAAEATRLRNTPPSGSGVGFPLIYLNCGSTPGEAGLDMLAEVKGQAIARHFAAGAGLPLLGKIGNATVRALGARLEDTSVPTLARFAELAQGAAGAGELYPLPCLGLLPDTLDYSNDDRPTAVWVQSFDAIASGKYIEVLRGGLRWLRSLKAQERERLSNALQREVTLPPLGRDPVDILISLGHAAEKYAAGLEQDPSTLCGLSRELLVLLRDEDALQRLMTPDKDDGDHDKGDEPKPKQPPGDEHAWSEAELVVEFGEKGAVGEAVELEVEKYEVRLVLQRGGKKFVLQPVNIPPAVLEAVEQETRLWSEGGALNIASAAAVLGHVKPSKSPNCTFRLEAHGQLPSALKKLVEEVHARRGEVLRTLTKWIPTHDDDKLTTPQLAVVALETFPLIAVANAKAEVIAYLAAYETLVRASFGADLPTPQKLGIALTNLDLGYAVDPQKHAVAARLLPLHPLRLTRAVLWLGKRAEPPGFPSNLAIAVGQSAEPLYPHGDPGCFHKRTTFGPSREGLVEAARQGMGILWSVLAPRDLMAAIDVEVVNVNDPVSVVSALYDTAADLFEGDSSAGEGLHLRIYFAHGPGRSPDEVLCPREDDFPALAATWGALPGSGVTIELVRKPVAAGSLPVHLSLEAVETPFLSFVPSGSSTGWDVDYIPGRSGNIMAIELSGNGVLDSYRQVLREHNFDVTRGFDPANESGDAGKALIKTFVAPGGWPVRPSASDCLVAYEAKGRDVIATLGDGEVLEAEVLSRLKALSTADASLTGVREGMLSLFSCRSFLARLLEGGDARSLLGSLGLLRSFGVIRSGSPTSGEGDLEVLALSMDGPEGLAWARTMQQLVGGDRTRADLVIVEADRKSREVRRIRVAELKSRTHLSGPDSVGVEKQARQALITATRIRCAFSGEHIETSILRAALRRLLWMGAGQQQAAFAWRDILQKLDAKLLAGGMVDVPVVCECWLIPETWEGPTEFARDLRCFGPNCELSAGDEEVLFRVLQPAPAAGPQNLPTPPTPPPTGQVSSPQGEAKKTPESPPNLPAAPAARVVSPMLSHPEKGPSAARGSPASGVPAAWSATVESNPIVVPTTEPTSARSESPTAKSGIEVRFGRLLPGNAEALWLPNRADLVTHFNVGITGTMGTGKTQFTKSLVAQIMRLSEHNPGGRRPGVLIFDYKGDYVDTAPGGFAHAIGAKVLEPHNLPINPLHTSTPKTKLDLRLAAREFADTIRSIAKAMGDVQRQQLIEAVQACLADSGVDEGDPSTWNRPFPTVADLFGHISNTGMTGTPVSVLHDLSDLEVFAEEDPSGNLDDFLDGAHVIDLRKLAGAEAVIRSVISFFMNAFYGRMIQRGESVRESRLIGDKKVELRELRRLVLVDEADDFMGLNLVSLKNVMQQGRAFGCGVILSTQFLHHFDSADSPFKPLVGTWILHRMSDVNAASLRGLFGLPLDQAQNLAGLISALDVHTSYCYGLSSAQRAQIVRVRDLPFFEL